MRHFWDGATSDRPFFFKGIVMAIPEHHSRNFQTLLRTSEDGNLALLQCSDALSGEVRYVICAVGRDGPAYIMTPFGHLCDGDPYAA